jgi:hypothetical protein
MNNEKLAKYLKSRTVYTIDSSNHTPVEGGREKQPLPIKVQMDQSQYANPFHMICYVISEEGSLIGVRATKTPIEIWKDVKFLTGKDQHIVHVIDVTTQEGIEKAYKMATKEQNLWKISKEKVRAAKAKSKGLNKELF